ncbi:MAG TPA: hypothetical protein VKV02_06895, partial [Acidobacteriaceae bacterium]|nr:hypothetical protein [Acidobacteriaceae bacterium]
LVVPWSDPASGARFVNLRAEPYDLAEVPEADAYPALRRALRALNAQGSAFLTAKCDAWTLYAEDGAEKLEALRLDLDVSDEEVAFGFGSYIDLVPRERTLFASAHVFSERLDRMIRRATRLPHPYAALEATMRPALVELRGVQEGYSVTLYITGVAGDPDTAAKRWEAALEDIVHLLREREWAVPVRSATID